MEFNSAVIKDFIRKVAPTAAAALGGPLAGGVVAALSNAILGHPNGSELELETAIANGQLTGEQLVAIKQIEADLKKHESDQGFKYADLEFKKDQLVIQDIQDARQRQIATKDNMPQIITCVAFIIYVMEFIFFASGSMPQDEFTKALITRAFGTVDGILMTCVVYFVGSSRGSATARDTIARIAEAPIPAPVLLDRNGDVKKVSGT